MRIFFNLKITQNLFFLDSKTINETLKNLLNDLVY